MRSIFHAALVAATLLLCANAAFAAGASSTVSALPTNTTNPLVPNSCLYVDQAGADTKLCSNWAHAFLGGSTLSIADGGTGMSFWPPADIAIGNGTQVPNFLAPINGDCVVGTAGTWAAEPCPGGGSGTLLNVALAMPGSLFNVTGSPLSGAGGTLTATPQGNSGGLVYFNSPSSMISSAALASGLPILGGGAGGTPTTGTLSGNTTKFATVSGAVTSTHCAAFDASGNIVDNGGACGSGGTGTVLSVGLSVPGSSIFASSGGPVTGTGTLALGTTGTSGGIPYFSSTTQLNTSAALTANMPVIGGGAGTAPTVGTVSGNTTKFATVSGSLVSGDCLKADASGNIADQGAACGSGGGGGSVSVTASSPNVLIAPTPGTGTFTIGTTTPQDPQAGGSYTIVAADGAKVVVRGNGSAQTDTVPDTTGSFASGFSFDLFPTLAGDTITRTSTSNINGLTSIKIGANQDTSWSSDGTNWHVALALPQPPTQTGTTCLLDNMTWGTCGSGGGGSVSVTSATPNLVITPSPGTGTFTIGATNPFNTITGASYGLAATDSGKTVAMTSGSATTTAIASASTTGFTTGFETLLSTHSAGDTFTPTTSTVDGLTSLILGKYQAADIQSDGSNYQAFLSVPIPPTQAGTTCLFDNMAWGTCGSGSLPTLAPGHVLGNGNVSSAVAGDTALVGGAGINISQSSNTITVTATGGGAVTTVVPPGGRLNLSTTPFTPVMTSDVVGASRIFYTCYNGGTIPYFNGTSDSNDPITSCQMSTALEASGPGVENAGDLFDIWYVHGATHICVATNGSGGGWTSDTGGSLTARGTGYTQIDPSTRGYYTNANVIGHCVNGTFDFGSVAANQATYLGTFYTTAAGQTTMQFSPAATSGGSNGFMGVWNAYNRVPYSSGNRDTNGATYTSTFWRYADNSANNRISFVDGLAQSPAIAFDTANLSISGASGEIGVLENQASGTTPALTAILASSTLTSTISVQQNFAPSIGLNFIQAAEVGNTGDFFGQTQLVVQVPM